MPLWLSGDSTTFVKSYINTGGSSPSKGSNFKKLWVSHTSKVRTVRSIVNKLKRKHKTKTTLFNRF